MNASTKMKGTNPSMKAVNRSLCNTRPRWSEPKVRIIASAASIARMICPWLNPFLRSTISQEERGGKETEQVSTSDPSQSCKSYHTGEPTEGACHSDEHELAYHSVTADHDRCQQYHQYLSRERYRGERQYKLDLRCQRCQGRKEERSAHLLHHGCFAAPPIERSADVISELTIGNCAVHQDSRMRCSLINVIM